MAHGLAPQMVAELEQIRHEIVERVRRVAPGEAVAASDELEEIINNWVRRASESRNLVYSDPRDPARSLLIAAEDDSTDALPTLWSLRDVDKSSNLFLVR